MTEPWWAGSPVGPPPQPAARQPSPPQQQPPWMPPPGVVPPTSRPAAQPWTPQPAAPQQQPWMPQPPPYARTQQLPAASPRAGGPTTMSGGPVQPGQQGQQQSTEPWVVGLGVLGFLLVAGAIAFVALVASEWMVAWGRSVDACLGGEGAWECFVNADWRERVLLPIVAALAAFALARGAGVERKQRRPIGYLYALAGFAVLGFAWVVGA